MPADVNLSKLPGLLKPELKKLVELRLELEVFEVPALPAYEQGGVEVLHQALAEITGVISYVASVHSRAVLVRGEIRRMVYTADQIYRSLYDTKVAQTPNNSAISWDHQASLIRVSLLDDTMILNQIKNMDIKADTEFAALEVLARARYRLRNDISPLLDTLRVGNILGEA